jgi:hypothetical protein
VILVHPAPARRQVTRPHGQGRKPTPPKKGPVTRLQPQHPAPARRQAALPRGPRWVRMPSRRGRQIRVPCLGQAAQPHPEAWQRARRRKPAPPYRDEETDPAPDRDHAPRSRRRGTCPARHPGRLHPRRGAAVRQGRWFRPAGRPRAFVASSRDAGRSSVVAGTASLGRTRRIDPRVAGPEGSPPFEAGDAARHAAGDERGASSTAPHHPVAGPASGVQHCRAVLPRGRGRPPQLIYASDVADRADSA